MKMFALMLSILLISALNRNHDFHLQKANKTSSQVLRGMYKSNYYKRDFYYIADDPPYDTLVEHGKPRNICDFIYFLPDSNKIMFDDESWGTCWKVRHEMLSKNRPCWIGEASYEISGDSLKIYQMVKSTIVALDLSDSARLRNSIVTMLDSTFDKKANWIYKKELMYSGYISKGDLILQRNNASMIYSQKHSLVFKKCWGCN